MGKGSGSGFAGPGAELLDELFDGGALGGANVVAAVGDADEEGEVIVEVEEFTEAEAGVEMVASAGGDFGFGCEKAFDGGDGAFGDGESVLGGVNDEGMEGELLGDLTGELLEGIGVAGGGCEAEDLADLVGFLFVEAKDDVEVFLEADDEVEGMADVIVIAFFGIGEVEEYFATGPGELGAEFFEDGFPDLAHVGEHGPVHETDEAGGVEFLCEAIAAEALLDRGPGDFFQGGMLADHDLAVVELEGVRMAGFGDAVDFGALGELGEDGVKVRVSKDAEVGDLDAEAGEGVGHDGAVAAEFNDVGDDFEVGAFAGGSREARGESIDGGHAGEGLGAGPFVHHMDDFVDESIEADEGGEFGHAGGGLVEALGALFAERIGVDHRVGSWRMGVGG
jgi:hypothetical protein